MHATQGCSAKGNNKEMNAQNKAAIILSSEEKKLTWFTMSVKVQE